MKVVEIKTEQQWLKACQIRKDVFVLEQQVPIEDEFDTYDKDPQTIHILIEIEEKPAATGRVRIVNGKGKLERICVQPYFRKRGLGKKVVLALETILKKSHISFVYLHGQTHAEAFYHKLGYQTTSPMFMEDGIPHYVMEKELA